LTGAAGGGDGAVVVFSAWRACGEQAQSAATAQAVRIRFITISPRQAARAY
jgi:hypothetical protein